MNFQEFTKTYPQQTMTLHNGKQFTYRLYENTDDKPTVVLLAGGIGLSDLFYVHFQKFAAHFSVMTFDFQMQFANHSELAEAVAEVLVRLNRKAWFAGQSLGGVIAQIIAKHHPECVDGLALSNTCTLAADISREAYEQTHRMVRHAKRSKYIIPFIPFRFYIRCMKKFIGKKKTKEIPPENMGEFAEAADLLSDLLTKRYISHMESLLADIENYADMKPADFQYLKDRVLLILSEDDDTFNQENKDALVNIMCEPTVVRNLTGGHLGPMFRADAYVQIIADYIDQRTEKMKSI